MRAKRVKGLSCDAPLADGAQRTVAVRLAELCAFVPRVLDPAEVEALHDMRIAAKRLRYVLEVTAEPCFGPYARTAAKRVRELQDLLGEIHDADVAVPRLLALIDELREADVARVLDLAGHAVDPDPALAAATPTNEAWAGLEATVVHLRARRGALFAQFEEMWLGLERDGFRARLAFAITERPPETVPA